MAYRFYSIVAGLYLSDLQKGLQTAHAVSEVYATLPGVDYGYDALEPDDKAAISAYDTWATCDKTIIILTAANHAGVLDAADKIKSALKAGNINLPHALFREDEQSMNGMATAFGIVVPEMYWNVTAVRNTKEDEELTGIRISRYVSNDDPFESYEFGTPEYDLINTLKSYNLA